MHLFKISLVACCTALLLLGCDTKVPEKHVQPDKDPGIVGQAGSNARADATTTDYRFEPVLSILEGTLHQVTFFGAPGYGANPETDLQEEGFVLHLGTPITIIEEATAPAERKHNEGIEGITEVQLIPHTTNLPKYKGLKMRITGTLFRAHTVHHHMPVLMDVQRIEEL